MREKTKAFVNHRDNGFALTFPNGNSISTIFGFGSYTENRNWKNPKSKGEQDLLAQFAKIPEGSNTVECMPNCSERVMDILQEKFLDNSNGSVFGHLTIDQWFEMVDILRKEK